MPTEGAMVIDAYGHWQCGAEYGPYCFTAEGNGTTVGAIRIQAVKTPEGYRGAAFDASPSERAELVPVLVDWFTRETELPPRAPRRYRDWSQEARRGE
jgi:hypothetical protein